MTLQADDLARIAKLARLDIPAAQAPALLSQMNQFFTLVDQMQAVDTSDALPLAHPTAAVQEVALRLRPDVVSEPNAREANMQNAPAAAQGVFLVPRVIE